jgi:cytochrome c peroxidase
MRQILAIGCFSLLACKTTPETKTESALATSLPALPLGLSKIEDPADNPTTLQKVLLGQQLFFDKRLSKDGTQGCVNCHYPEKAFTSGNALDAKVGGAMNKRNSPSMLNLGYHNKFYWDGRGASLEATALAAWKGQLQADPAVVCEALGKDEKLVAQFVGAFQSGPSPENVSKAMASFFRALNNGNSAWDRAQAGDTKAMSDSAKAGEKLFLSSGCATCHTPPLFSDFGFHNAGIGADVGRGDITKDPLDNGKFKTPSLRNVAQTGPYFHDGSVATLEGAIELMAKGGNENANRDPLFVNTKWSAQDMAHVKNFLESLTGVSTFGAPKP